MLAIMLACYIAGIVTTIGAILTWYWFGTNQLMTGIYQDDDVMKNYGEIMDEQEREVGSSQKAKDPRRD